jgi:nucleoside-diphosphate-sugar epimerase
MIKKNILITGFDGFLARNLVKKIDFNKYNLYGIGNSKKKYHKNFLSIKKKINSKNLNFFKKKKIDIIVHCAGSPKVGLEHNEDFKKNALTTFEILEFARSSLRKPKIIIASSLAVYGNHYKNKIKKISEEICLFYSKNFNINILILRIASVFGIGLKKQFIYEATKKILNNNFNFWGSGNETRDYINIEDICEIISRSLKKNFYGSKIINCGTGNVYKTRDIIVMIKEILKINNNKLKFSGFRLKQNPKKLVPSLRKLKNFFKFKTKRDFQNDLKEFVLQQKKLH